MGFHLIPKRKETAIFFSLSRVGQRESSKHLQQRARPLVVTEWKSYNGLVRHGYHHHTVNHGQAFVSNDGTQINTLEGLHNKLKLELIFASD